MVPEAKGQFNPQQGVPTVEYLEVTPGTDGYEAEPPEAIEAQGLQNGMPQGLPAELMQGGSPMPPPPVGMGGI